MMADELLSDGFCLNLPDSPLCPLKARLQLQNPLNIRPAQPSPLISPPY